MKFFIPFTTDVEQAQLVYEWVETRLQRLGLPSSKEPVFQVTSQQGSELITDTVGQKSLCTGEVVMIILKSDLEVMICSYGRGIMRGEPVRIPFNLIETVIVFD